MKKILVSALATIALAASAANITWGQLGTIEETANVVTDVKIPTVVAGTPAATDLTVTVTPVVDANSTTNSYEITVAAPAGFDPTALQAAIDDLCVSTQALQTAVTTLGTDKANKATTLSGYGITDAVPNTRTVNTKALSADITLDASDVGAIASTAVSEITWDNEIDGEISNLHETIVALKQLITALGGTPPAAGE
jgi:hypothetical protein